MLQQAAVHYPLGQQQFSKKNGSLSSILSSTSDYFSIHASHYSLSPTDTCDNSTNSNLHINADLSHYNYTRVSVDKESIKQIISTVSDVISLFTMLS